MFLSASFLVGTGIRTIRQRSIPFPVPADDTTSMEIPALVGSGDSGGSETSRDAEFIRIHINHCSAEDLERLPGIGPVAAAKIVAYRQENGFFRTFEELDRVHGIGKKTLEKIKPYIVVDR